MVHGAYDADGNDLSACAADAASEIERLREQLARVHRWVKAFGSVYEKLSQQVDEALQPNAELTRGHAPQEPK